MGKARRVRWIAWALGAGVALATLVTASAAAGGDWSGSLITSSSEKVEVDGTLTFTVSVVNSQPVTASNVLLLNPVPEHTTFVSATAPASETMILVAGATGESTRQVETVAWVGDMAPGSFIYTLTLRVSGGAGRMITNTVNVYYAASLDATLEKGVEVKFLTQYLPVMLNGYTSSPSVTQTGTITLPLSVRYVHSAGDDHAEAHSSAGVWDDSEGFGTFIATNDFDYYYISRGFAQASVPDIGGARVVSAGLSIVPCAGWRGYLDPLPAPTVRVSPGTWGGSLESVDRDVLWTSFTQGVSLGTYNATAVYGVDCYLNGASRIVIPLDDAYVTPGQEFRIVVRDDQDHINLRPSYAGHSREWYAKVGEPVWLEIGFGE